MVLIGKATSENPGLRGPLAAPRVGFLCSLIILVSYFWRGAEAPHTAALSAVESYRALMHCVVARAVFMWLPSKMIPCVDLHA